MALDPNTLMALMNILTMVATKGDKLKDAVGDAAAKIGEEIFSKFAGKAADRVVDIVRGDEAGKTRAAAAVEQASAADPTFGAELVDLVKAFEAAKKTPTNQGTISESPGAVQIFGDQNKVNGGIHAGHDVNLGKQGD